MLCVAVCIWWVEQGEKWGAILLPSWPALAVAAR